MGSKIIEVQTKRHSWCWPSSLPPCFLYGRTFSVIFKREREREKIWKESPETILEPSWHMLQVTHPPCTSRLSAFSLLTPLIWSDFCWGIATWRARCDGLKRILYNWQQNELLCCRWKARLPQRRQRVCDLVCLLLMVWYEADNKGMYSGQPLDVHTQRMRYLSVSD